MILALKHFVAGFVTIGLVESTLSLEPTWPLCIAAVLSVRACQRRYRRLALHAIAVKAVQRELNR